MSLVSFKPEVGLVDLIALSTTTSVVIATTYNFGFFFSLQGSLVSFLAFEDILIGSAISILPVGLVLVTVQIMHPVLANLFTKDTADQTKPHNLIRKPVFSALLDFDRIINPSQSSVSSWKQRVAFVLAFGLLVASVVSLAIYDGRYWIGYAGTFGALGFWFVYLSSVGAHISHYAASAVVLVLGLPFMVGYSDYHSALRAPLPGPSTVVEMSDDSVVRGTLIRATSAFLFVYENSEMKVLPLACVARISRGVER